MSLATLAVTAPDPDWAPGRSERVLRALVAAPAVGATLLAAMRLFGEGAVYPPRLAAMVLVLAVELVLLGTSSLRRTPASVAWAPPLRPNGALHLPPLCRAFKRSLDVVVGTLALLLALPVLVLAALAIKCDSRGPWLFRQTRLGTAGRPFTVFKLRTMRTDNDPVEHEKFVAQLIRGDLTDSGEILKLTADPRMTRVGRTLRRLSVDEIPQLLNVLVGSMSLVGPRPPLPREVALYDERARQRLAVKPGMTGLWQVSGRSRLSFPAMVELDIRYWLHWTPLLELSILARTPKVAFISRETA